MALLRIAVPTPVAVDNSYYADGPDRAASSTFWPRIRRRPGTRGHPDGEGRLEITFLPTDMPWHVREMKLGPLQGTVKVGVPARYLISRQARFNASGTGGRC